MAHAADPIHPAARTQLPPGSPWTRIQGLRQAADGHLAAIGLWTGEGSRLHRHCREVWGDWEREALISILHRDLANAEVLLDRGAHALRHALDLVQQDRLSEEDLVKLIAAA
jgi:hypothetical protein